ncbi:unnamed protein product [Symbiodinium natans]|uniref:Uncharacterized protein n=1 Tax=Symbiodinium natans TaxID=878477 RepID=A0A812L6H7_9DINO|nr:unnamed protein product [Symbiodinium natans]
MALRQAPAHPTPHTAHTAHGFLLPEIPQTQMWSPCGGVFILDVIPSWGPVVAFDEQMWYHGWEYVEECWQLLMSV